MRDPIFEKSWAQISALIITLIPEYKKEGKSYLIIAFGSTGGKHHSTFMAEILYLLLKENKHNVNLLHRELSL